MKGVALEGPEGMWWTGKDVAPGGTGAVKSCFKKTHEKDCVGRSDGGEGRPITDNWVRRRRSRGG